MIDVARAVFCQSEYRTTAPAIVPTTQTADQLASVLSITSLIQSQADAQTFRDDIIGVRSLGRGDWQMLMKRDVISFEIGDTITVKHARFGLSGGGDFIVKGKKRDSSSNFLQITMFGPR